MLIVLRPLFLHKGPNSECYHTLVIYVIMYTNILYITLPIMLLLYSYMGYVVSLLIHHMVGLHYC